MFSGKLKCPECGGNLNFHFNQGNHDIKFFSCKNHNSGLRKCSSTHYIRLDFLEQVVLYEIHRLAAFASEYEQEFLETVRRYTNATTITRRMVSELIDHIDVYHAEKRDGVTNQRLVIYYNCIGAFDVPD